MRLIYTYITLITFLIFATPLQQLLKTPTLFRHYLEHKAISPDISFSNFIFMHYVGDDGVPDDENKDMQLPFKQYNTHSSIDIYTIPILNIALENRYIRPIKYLFPQDQNILKSYTAAVFKPPQIQA